MTKQNKIRIATGAALVLLLLLLFCPKKKKLQEPIGGAGGGNGGAPGGNGGNGVTAGQEPMITMPTPPPVDYEGDIDDFGAGETNVIDVVEKEPPPPPPVVHLSTYELEKGVGEQAPVISSGGAVRG